MSWRGLDHRTIYEMVVNGGQGTGMSLDAEQRWAKVQQTITDAEQTIGIAMQESQTGWEGAGAEAMRGAYTPLGAWALDAAVSAQVTAIAVRNQGQLAFETRRLVTDNAPPNGFLQEVHAVVGTWDDGRSVYADQADAVGRLMVDYESASEQNEAYFDTWSVPPTVAVSTASAAPGGGGGGAVPDTAGLTPAGGSGSGAAPGVGGGALQTGAAGGPAGGTAPGGSFGAAGSSAGGPGAARSGGGSGAGSPTGRGPAGVGSGPGTGGVATPSIRPRGSPGGSGTGVGPWTRAATGTGRSPVGATPFRPVVPAVPPRPSLPDWRSALLPPERSAASTGPGGPGAPRGSTPTPGIGTAAAQASGTRTGSPGMHAPMMGASAGGGQGSERRRPSYLVDDSDAFVDKRWIQPAVITPEDLIPDEYGRYPGQ